MAEVTGFAVFFFPQALEALGDAIKPYLQDGPAGPHILCNEIDTGGALIEMTIEARDREGKTVELQLMVPTSMVRMIVSARGEAAFGFGPRAEAPVPALPPVGPTAEPAEAPPQAVPSPATPQAPSNPPPSGPPETLGDAPKPE
ncbi:hypothetical protein [Aerolutibacter ruishenii]|uniref:Stringent starvation protein B n=1 Tax=Aerolutibacter ruishenii TaxID=686800 RepID=A0A562LI86_9GAMM|nr:hypothetical protein [Lysobacter ruishenii]TWI07339.1 hypothetical protein IP93_02693 [Lysobacter ruishenii]